MTLRKAEIIETFSLKLGLETKTSSDILEFMLETIKTTLIEGEDVSISGFGKWNTRDKRPRLGRNPKTGKEVEITARRVVSFKPSKILRDRMS